jgi:hypothetical protein
MPSWRSGSEATFYIWKNAGALAALTAHRLAVVDV